MESINFLIKRTVMRHQNNRTVIELNFEIRIHQNASLW